jgi:HAD superfamily phosphoserine phosphatase-like hydrolase
MSSSPGSVVAFFDFDDTLSAGDSLLYWLHFYYSHRPRKRIFQIANLFGVMLFLLRVWDSHTLKRLFLWPMAFENKAELDKLAHAFVMNDLAYRFHRPVLERLWSHHLLGHRVVVISASATFYLKHLLNLLPPVELLGTEVQFPETGLRFPQYRDGNLRGDNKIKRLKALGYGDAGPLGFAYSDHHHDMPLLAFAEFPTCIFPTPRLRRRATSLNWPIWSWPGRPPLWRRRLHKLGLLVFAAEWFSEVTPESRHRSLPGQPGQDVPFLREHAKALRDRVLEKYHGDQGERLVARVMGPTGRSLGF